jgi:hypothetical protein
MMVIFARLGGGAQKSSTQKPTPTSKNRHFRPTQIQNHTKLATQSCRGTDNFTVFWTGTN